MSSEPSSHASPPPPSSPQEEMGGRRRAAAAALSNGNGFCNDCYDAGLSQSHELASPAPSKSHIRVRQFANASWPYRFLESLAIKVAVDVSRSFGRTAAASALVILFQVCSRWRKLSRSDKLWRKLTKRIWKKLDHRLNRNWSWRDKYIYRHRTARNFPLGRYNYRALKIRPREIKKMRLPPKKDNMQRPTCLRLALSDVYVAAGYSNGVVQLFRFPSRQHQTEIRPHERNGLGLFHTAVSGIILYDTKLVIASLDGYISVVLFNDFTTVHVVHRGNIALNGVLVDFSGRHQWWVGLYVGAAGRSFHIWDSGNGEELFVGGGLTDEDSSLPSRLLNNLSLANSFGRVRVASESRAVACTRNRVISFNIVDICFGFSDFDEISLDRRVLVKCFDVSNGRVMLLDGSDWIDFRIANSLERRFLLRFRRRYRFGEEHDEGECLLGCFIFGWNAIIIDVGGAWIRICSARRRTVNPLLVDTRLSRVEAIVADSTHVAICTTNRLHVFSLWPGL